MMNAPVAPDLDRALQSAADLKASDLYFIPGEPLAFRVGNEIVRTEGDALNASDIRAIAIGNAVTWLIATF